jgi:hypothetical protein
MKILELLKRRAMTVETAEKVWALLKRIETESITTDAPLTKPERELYEKLTRFLSDQTP